MLAVRFPSLYKTTPTPIGVDWPALVAVLSDHRVRADKNRGPLWSPAIYEPCTTRANRNVRAVTAFVADLDGDPLEPVIERLDQHGVCWHAYTTHSHRDHNERWHVVIPFAEPVPVADWPAVWATVHAWVGAGDPTTNDPARVYYLPQHAAGNPWAAHTGHGRFLNPATLPAVAPAVKVRPASSLRPFVPAASDGFRPSVWPEVIEYRKPRATNIPAAAAELLAEFRTMRAAGQL